MKGPVNVCSTTNSLVIFDLDLINSAYTIPPPPQWSNKELEPQTQSIKMSLIYAYIRHKNSMATGRTSACHRSIQTTMTVTQDSHPAMADYMGVSGHWLTVWAINPGAKV